MMNRTTFSHVVLACSWTLGSASFLFAQQPAPVKPTVPKVVLSAEHAADCIVAVGDVFPEPKLSDDAGKLRTIKEIRGMSLATLVVFFRGDHPIAADAFKMLENEIVKKYAGKVAVVAVHYDTPAGASAALIAAPGRTFPVLIDAERAAIGLVAKNARLPRLYLLDKDGKIAWFDIEFSEETRRQLHAGIHVLLLP